MYALMFVEVYAMKIFLLLLPIQPRSHHLPGVEGGIKHRNSCGCMNTVVSDSQLRIFSCFPV